MKHRTDNRKLLGLLGNTRQQVVGFDVVPEAQGRQIPPFFRGPKAVADQDILKAAAVQFPNDGTADKARAAGDQNQSLRKIGLDQAIAPSLNFAWPAQ